MLKQDLELQFKTIKFVCKCGNTITETLLVWNKTGFLDIKCPVCNLRITKTIDFDDLDGFDYKITLE
ncbi:hypothetical protein JCM14244_07700 [Venenivibrio stagnispumantis]|uniref:Uncharacterized protein n=1 Tax=Venenivibrio stagnispumantis TaxID=407998 RepID=A0AA45WNU4_9AQUI|nr:hypothetical protein [Venenivibrio stagnispumantis]MCW4573831.1 hypothetical protein [Venenivibrio stagnispumantis]SMP18892.1 hypothetical protein SAMN06264868_11829 [Venenivibrio stagnispumantis]